MLTTGQVMERAALHRLPQVVERAALHRWWRGLLYHRCGEGCITQVVERVAYHR